MNDKEKVSNLTFEIDARVYSLEAIKQALYQLTNKYFIEIRAISDISIEVDIAPKGKMDVPENIRDQIINEMLEFQIRIDTENEYKTVRDALVRRAFEPVDKE